MQIKTPAKINLSLDIVERLPNGYHSLRTVMQTVPWYDEITIEKAPTITLRCNLPYLPCDSKNVAYAAAQAFFNATGMVGGASIFLQKSIPSGAGLGGGSGNAAGVILALNQLYGANLSTTECEQIGATIGADVPFFMRQGACLAEGVGERLTSIPPLRGGFVVIAKPRFGISTQWAYQNFNANSPRPFATDAVVQALQSQNFAAVAKNLGNALEQTVTRHHPLISEWTAAMRKQGALGSIMSGSGSSVFGLFQDKRAANRCAQWFRPRAASVFVSNL